jgi:glycerate kinase
VASWLDLDSRVARADVVITGEGRFDDTSLRGKGPGAVAQMGLALGKTVHVFAGQAALSQRMPGLFIHEITPAGTPMKDALECAPAFLERAIHLALTVA